MHIQSTIDVRTNFKLAQEKLGLSRRIIAERSGMPPGTMSGLLSHNNPTIQQLIKLSQGLGVSIRYLIEGGDPEEELKKNYVFVPLQEPTIDSKWKPERPNVAARVLIILKKTKQTKIHTAKRINVIPSWWSPILKRNNPTVKVLQKIAHALDVKPVELIEPVPNRLYGKIMIPKVHY